MLAAHRAVHHCGARLSRDSARGSRSNRAIDHCERGPVLIDVFQYLSNEVASLEWKTNMHHIRLGDGCRLIDIYAECLIRTLHNLQQRLADFAQPHYDNRLIHSFDRILPE